MHIYKNNYKQKLSSSSLFIGFAIVVIKPRGSWNSSLYFGGHISAAQRKKWINLSFVSWRQLQSHMNHPKYEPRSCCFIPRKGRKSLTRKFKQSSSCKCSAHLSYPFHPSKWNSIPSRQCLSMIVGSSFLFLFDDTCSKTQLRLSRSANPNTHLLSSSQLVPRCLSRLYFRAPGKKYTSAVGIILNHSMICFCADSSILFTLWYA